MTAAPAPCLMLQGTAAGVGKRLLTAHRKGIAPDPRWSAPEPAGALEIAALAKLVHS